MATGGIAITQGVAASLGALASVAITTAVTNNNGFTAQKATGIYRPPIWANKKATYSIVVPKSSTQDALVGVPISNLDSDGNPIIGINAVGITMYVFDAVKVVDHRRSLEPTRYPVQTGYNQSYNAILKPNLITLEVGMSDAMDAYESGMWTGNISKSVSAWQEMKSLQANRAFLTLNTRLESYENMLLVDVSAKEDNSTIASAKMLLTFEQIFVAQVSVQTISARPNAIGNTSLGNINGSNVPSANDTNNNLPSETNPNLNVTSLENQFGTPVNAGTWSSNNTNSIIPTLSGGS
jgi:hypothetical protein